MQTLRLLSTKSKVEEAKILIADLTRKKELIYTGPMNSMVRSLQVTSASAAIGTAVGSPLFLHYFTHDWGFGSQLLFTLAVSGAAGLQCLLSNRILSRYVAQICQLIPDSHSVVQPQTATEQADRYEFVTYDLLGRPKKRIFSPTQLEADRRGEWTPLGSSRAQPYLLVEPRSRQTGKFQDLARAIERDEEL